MNITFDIIRAAEYTRRRARQRQKVALERAAADYEHLHKKHEELCAAVVDALEKDESTLYAKGEPVETSLRVAVKNITAAARAVDLAAGWYA